VSVTFDYAMKLSIIMPVYNEAATLREIAGRVLALPIDLELIAVNDGSSDGSGKILKDIGDPRLRVLTEERNRGKGWAVRRGLAEASGDAVVIQDADLEYDPQDLVKLFGLFQSGASSVIYGNRLHKGNPRFSYQRYLLGGMIVSFFTNLLYGSRVEDEPTCYKLFDARLIKSLRLTCTGFEFCPEATAKVLRLGCEILEVPIRYQPRDFAHGKKIHWQDGVHALWVLLKIRFMPRRRLLKEGTAIPPSTPRPRTEVAP
jgi:dolichol-phosphate mannosyltransferase